MLGRDVRRFANGMFTNNIRDLAVGGGNRNAMCDAKGRLLGILDVYLASETEARVVLEGETAEAFVGRYAKYVVFDDVELIDRTTDVAVLTVQGPRAAAGIEAAALPVPRDGIASRDGVDVLRRDRCGAGGFDVIVPADRRDDAIARLLRDADGPNALSPADELERLRVRAGKARWPEDAPGRALIHELNLRDEVCSFEKGCYIGQEVVNRLDVMGQIRKHLVGVRLVGLPAGEPVASGTELRAGDAIVGKLTSPVYDAELGWIGLAIVRIPHDAPGTELACGPHAAVISALPFPA